MEFIDLPLRRHDCRCVHSRMNRRSPFGPGLPHPVHVPSLPFLPASTVSSAARRGPKTSSLGSSQVCCTLQPTVGSTSFRVLSDPKIPSRNRLGVARIREPFPEVQTLRSVLLPGSSLPSPRSPAFTRKRCLLAVGPFTRVATDDRLIPRPQGLAPPGSPFSRRNVAATLESMLPWAFGSTRSCLPRVSAPGEIRFSPCRSGGRNPRTVPEARVPGKAKSLGFVWLRRDPSHPPHPKVRRPSGTPRWQPEDCCAFVPPHASRRGEESGPLGPTRRPDHRPHHRHPEGRRRRGTWDPEGPHARAGSAPRMP